MQKSGASEKNIHALLQQRRLRHITGVCIRNLRIPHDSGSDNTTLTDIRNVSMPKIFFKIIVSADKKGWDSKDDDVIFESEHIQSCSNPQWMNFDIPKTELSTGNDFILQLWRESADAVKCDMLFSWNWNLSRLSYIAENLYRGEITFSPNALVIQVGGSFYSLSQCFSTDTLHGNCPHFNLDEEKGSCNILSLKRMLTCHRSIAQAKHRTNSYAESSRTLMQNSEMHRLQTKQIEDVRKRIKRLKLLLSRESNMLKSEQDELQTLQTTYEKKDKHLSENRTIVVDERDRFNEASDKIIILRQRTGLLNGKLRSRHMEVLSELAYIFPIHPHTLPVSGKNSSSSKSQSQDAKPIPAFTICDIYLPDAESLIPKDDTKNAVAMGYVSQMLYMISYFLLIPLRYPLVLQGSQTSIIDNVLEKIQEKERVFPLYSRSSKERFLFEYAIYLLNKNIGQMRYLLGIQTSDLRPTLFNLKTLLEHAFGAQNQSRVVVPRLPNPAQKALPTPAQPIPQKKEPTTESEMNGFRKTPVDLEEKVHDKSVELHNLRGELFGNKKTAKPVPISPRRFSPNPHRKESASPSMTHLTVPNETSKSLKNITHEDVSIVVPETGDTNAVFLSGLEDLDQSPKNAKPTKLQKVDVAAARNELFKTRSGRSVITKKHTYTIRTAPSSSHSENYFSTKEELFKRSTSSHANTTNDTTDNINGMDSYSESSSNIENNNLKISSSSAPLAISDDLDLC